MDARRGAEFGGEIFEKALDLDVEKGLDLPPDFLIGASLVQESRALRGVPLGRGVKERLDLLPLRSTHDGLGVREKPRTSRARRISVRDVSKKVPGETRRRYIVYRQRTETEDGA